MSHLAVSKPRNLRQHLPPNTVKTLPGERRAGLSGKHLLLSSLARKMRGNFRMEARRVVRPICLSPHAGHVG